MLAFVSICAFQNRQPFFTSTCLSSTHSIQGRDDKVFSLSITDVCRLTVSVREAPPSVGSGAVLGDVRQMSTFAFIDAVADKDITKIFALICHYCTDNTVNYKCKISNEHQDNTDYYCKKDATA